MSEPENFLARWSRRKAEAEQPAERAPEADQKAAGQDQPDSSVAAETQPEEGKKEDVDLSKLPPLESIGPDTDIRAFLQKGIPSDLTRAALRRVWASDPAIRNFIGIAENQYDFATGSDIPGFGPLTPADDVVRMVRQIMGEGAPRPLSPAEPEPSSEPDAPVLEDREAVSGDPSAAQQVAAVEDIPSSSDGAAQQDEVGKEEEEPPAPHSHGGALPR
jgi:hypothetical protein